MEQQFPDLHSVTTIMSPPRRPPTIPFIPKQQTSGKRETDTEDNASSDGNPE